MKVAIGQIVYLRRTYKNTHLYGESTVTKVGRKYANLANGKRFNLSNGYEVSNYSPDFKVYSNEQVLKDTIEKETLLKEIRQFFTPHNADLSLTKLRTINKIIKT